ncbi:HAMP domain-containing protein [Rhodococcus sp. 15-725-2-2b]|uniref:methyl-accepting chemotaxis protein n=2 Tax=unclassified Rhodococcus (in: high G+C Gram-positive bacteria) TaxID=192944 RepID=UPI0005EB9E0F|nr:MULTISPECIES: HAMP domain-containing protein [unclassified Rhodococcus (in: high G+C Gram-positive bacteria)]OZC64003.1 HAMP domain-containing protein [Rhodococcus sp. 06-469-3-2]OZD51552.1 HAMP domain-containing protein [Rhodococcus sp. 06-1477-1A]OZE03782.1 HAMP domain-containing protein [Rhodococcus sp. 05-2255-3B1]OZE10572.1 HAMP domain-containing protein [Rhodococcus sp. 05-2255-3C]OZE12023.1 HAMP domain-containing protein [Rhodococcus sp. 05-2255-2A2]OZE78633.1 HAMP domain-containing
MSNSRARARPRALSLHGRIRVLTMSVAALAVAVSALAIYLVAEQALRSQIVDRVERNSDALIASAASGVPAGLFGFGIEDTEGTAVKAALVTPDGTLVTSTTGTEPFTNSDGVLDDAEKSVVDGTVEQSLREVRGYYLSAARTGSGGTIMVAESLNEASPLLAKLTLALVIVGAFLVALAGVAGAAVARTGLRPVRRLRAGTERVARTGDFEPIDVNGDDELASLANSFNEMLASLSRSRARQGQLIVDAGAELMEPLTALRTNIDLLMSLDGPDAPSMSEDQQDRLRVEVIAQMDVIIGLVHDLVDHAREPAPTPQ